MTSPFMDTHEVAELLRMDRNKHPRLAAWRWIKRHGIPLFGDGHVLVNRNSVLDKLAELARKRETRKGRTQ